MYAALKLVVRVIPVCQIAFCGPLDRLKGGTLQQTLRCALQAHWRRARSTQHDAGKVPLRVDHHGHNRVGKLSGFSAEFREAPACRGGQLWNADALYDFVRRERGIVESRREPQCLDLATPLVSDKADARADSLHDRDPVARRIG